MSTLAIPSILARIVHATGDQMREHAKKHHNSRTVGYLETLPAYLRRDIGLPDNADIADLVEHGRVGRAVDRDTFRHLANLPHSS